MPNNENESGRMNPTALKNYGALESGIKIESDEDYAARIGLRPYGTTAGVAMCLNYIIGTGCVGLPYAMVECGMGLTTLLLFLGSLFAFISNNFSLESMARAQGVQDAVDEPRHRITYEKQAFSVIANRFGGLPGQRVVQLAVFTYCLGSLWSYASVFGSSVSSMFFAYVLGRNCNVYETVVASDCLASYDVCMVIFGVIVISLSLKNIADQVGVQQFLTGYRIFAFGLMFVTMAMKMYEEGSVAVYARAEAMGGFTWGRFGKGFGPLFLALTFQYNLPDALQALREKDKAQQVTTISSWVSVVLYFMLAVMGAVAFDDVNPLITLNWHEFTGCGAAGWAPCPHPQEGRPPFMAILIQTLVMLFPILAVMSSFPMVAITMADNLVSAVPEAISSRYDPETLSQYVRLASALPPLVLATFFKRLDFILTMAGLFGFILSYSIPGCLQLLSVKYCRTHWGEKSVATPYTWCTDESLLSGYIGLSIVLFVVGFYTTFD